MKESIRKDILEQKQKLEENNIKKEEILREIKELAQELKECEIVMNLKILGELYKENQEDTKKLERITNKKLNNSKDLCTHPILYRMGYERHYDESARLIKADRENALHCKVRCLECGKKTYTKNNDGSDDWDDYIMTPTSLGQYGEDYVKRVIIEPTLDLKYKELSEYYQGIMLDYPQKEVIKMIKQKIKEKK